MVITVAHMSGAALGVLNVRINYCTSAFGTFIFAVTSSVNVAIPMGVFNEKNWRTGIIDQSYRNLMELSRPREYWYFSLMV